MKAVRRSGSSACCREPRIDRKGSMFPTVIVYMTIVSVMLGLCGFSLHSMLRADRADRQAMLLLATLGRTDSQLRADNDVATLQAVTATDIRFGTADASVIHWVADRGMLVRTESKGEQVQHRERFVFPAGTTLSFRTELPGSLVLQVEEPSAFVAYPTAGGGGAQSGKPLPKVPDGAGRRPPVEIRMKTAVPPTGGAG